MRSSLSNPSKMPCKGYSLPATECKTGSRLRRKVGTVCSDCYACKGCYQFSNVQGTLYKRFEAIRDDRFVDAMVTMIGSDAFFRWHDSGDLQDIDHMLKIIEIAERTPHTKHWLPTKEKGLLMELYKAKIVIPDNLVIRYSMPMIDQKPRSILGGINTSHSVSSEEHATGHRQPRY